MDGGKGFPFPPETDGEEKAGKENRQESRKEDRKEITEVEKQTCADGPW